MFSIYEFLTNFNICILLLNNDTQFQDKSYQIDEWKKNVLVSENNLIKILA